MNLHLGRTWPRILLWTYCILLFGFLILPLAIVVPVSFSSAQYLEFPPPGYSTQWYASYFGDPEWIDATLLSVRVAVTVVALSVTLGLLAALAIVRSSIPGKAMLRMLLMTPLIVPTIIVAIAVYSIYSDLHLVGSFWGIVFAHTILALPFTMMLMTSGLERVDRRHEEASYTMGASAWHTFRRVTLPALRPSLLAASVFAFVASWDEIVMVLFIGGETGMTLPLKMWSYLRTEINPTIAAVSTILLTLVAVAFVAAEIYRARRERRTIRSLRQEVRVA
jgi:putative spermidine/putrescine transport system permease protein